MHAGADCGLAAWAERARIKQIVTPYIPEGPLRDWLRLVEPTLAARRELRFANGAESGMRRSGPIPMPAFSRSKNASPASSRICR